MTQERKQPDEPNKIPAICKDCPYYERCGMTPPRFTFRQSSCRYYIAFKYADKIETKRDDIGREL